MKACRQSRRLLELQFAGELSWKQELRLQEHVAECSECAVLSRAQDHVLESLGSYREAPLAKIDVQAFVAKVQDRIGSEPVGAAQVDSEERERSLKPFALAAVVMLALGSTWILKNSTTEPGSEQGTGIIAKGSLPQAPAPSEVELAPAAKLEAAGLKVEDTEYRADRHQAAISDLRSALGSLMGHEPDWTLYEARVTELRTAGWPMANLLSGLVGDEHLETAQAAIRALGQEGGRLAHRRLWNLRKDERLGDFAVGQLQAGGNLTMVQSVDLYWEGSQRAIALGGLASWKGPDALRGARRLVQEAPARKLAEADMTVVAGMLQRAGDAGSKQALAWLENARLPQDAWASQVARTFEPGDVLGSYLADGGGAGWETGALTLARYLADEQWMPFLEKCCSRSRTAERAVAALENQPGLQALELLLEQEDNRMVSEDVWLAAWDKALALDGARLVEVAKAFRAGGSRSELEQFADVLLIGEQVGSGAALVEVAAARDISERLRCTLVLKAGRLRESGTAYALESLLGELNRKDSELAACIVIALSNLHDAERLTALLERNSKASSEVIQQIIALCDTQSRRSERERRYLIARKLKKVLGRRNLSSLE